MLKTNDEKLISSTQNQVSQHGSKRGFFLGLAVSGLVLLAFFLGTTVKQIENNFPLNWLEEYVQDQMKAPTETSQSPLGELIGRENLTVPDVVEAASESVVTVSIKKRQQVTSPNGLFGFGQFGLQIPQEGEIQEVQRDIGTGFVVDNEGLVVTNKHVVSDPNAEYLVIDKENNEYKVTNIYRDPSNDLAIVKVENFTQPALPLGNSDEIRVGESVIAIGTALGEFRHTVTTGVVSGLKRGITAGDGISKLEELSDVIQTDAAINPGNSGGPLINGRGEVIGVNVAVSQAAENIGFAIPINIVKESLANFSETGQFDRPFLGVSYQTISEQAALANEVPQGAYIVAVADGSAAADIGLEPGDIVTEIEGKKLKDQELAQVVNKLKAGQDISVTYWRDGQSKTVKVQLKTTNLAE